MTDYIPCLCFGLVVVFVAVLFLVVCPAALSSRISRTEEENQWTPRG